MDAPAPPPDDDDDGWMPPVMRPGSLRLSLRRALRQAGRLCSDLARSGRARLRRLTRTEGEAASPSPARRDAADAVAILRSLGPWIIALRRKLDDEARRTGDSVYLMLARKPWGLGALRKGAVADKPAAPAPDAATLAAREAQHAERLARARAARREAAAQASQIGEVVNAMPVEAVAGELCAGLRRAAALTGRDDLRAAVERFIATVESLCARDPAIAPPRGRFVEPGSAERVLARIGPVSSYVFDTG